MSLFDNTEFALAYKSNSELKKAHWLFKLMGNNSLLKLGLWVTPLAIRWNLPFTKSAMRNTIFKQFVGGETLEETAAVAEKLGAYNVQVILDYGVEGGDHGEAGYDESTGQFIRVINYASGQKNIPFMSIKITGIARFSLLEKLEMLMHTAQGTLIKRYNAALNQLPEIEKEEWTRVEVRLRKICLAASQKNIGVLVDAEETWIQDPIDALTLLVMDEFNKKRAVIYNTIQLYRHDRLQFVKDCFEASVERNFILGAKLVRGAYMEKERNRAAEMGYRSPIQPDKASTDQDFDSAVRFCIEHVESIASIIATHNEKSNLLATELCIRAQVPRHHPHVHFSQLYGMSDNITFNLAHEGFSVSKYLPFGPVKDVIPYLMRRAQENTSVSGQTGRELSIIEKELQRRSSVSKI